VIGWIIIISPWFALLGLVIYDVIRNERGEKEYPNHNAQPTTKSDSGTSAAQPDAIER
jgi:hypothetical protein